MDSCVKTVVAALALLAAAAVRAAAPLPQLNIDASKISVSGLSSGGFMANQLGYAHSATFMGVGVFAAGPYMCAGHSHYTACMYNASIGAGMLNTMQADINNWSGTAIDDKANVAAQKVYLFVGSSDTTVGPNPMNAARTQYTNNGVAAANLEHVQRAGTAHTFPTDFAATGNNSCGSAASPYISNCGYDGAKAALTRFYGALNARNNAPAAANYIEFDQAAFHNGNPGMAATGWIYVPANCAAGTQCRLHVALHGCLQSYGHIGDKFIKNTGYTRWADTNSIAVLFPQTKTDSTSRSTAASGLLSNPNACWDWIGWYGGNFAQRAGTQVAAIMAMVDHIASGASGTLPAPAGVATSGATDTSMRIGWSAVSGAAGYNVYRGGSKVNATLVAGTSVTDGGLAPATTYSWTVSAVDADGREGAASAPASGTTTGSAALPAPTGVVTSNPTSSSMRIGWNTVAGAAGYNVYRGATKVNATPVAGTSVTDGGLAPATTYSWTVRALNGSGTEGAASAPASGTTASAATCFTSSNYAHTTAGRAHVVSGITYANGSNQNMGLWNVFVTTTLKQTGPNYYVIGTCP